MSHAAYLDADAAFTIFQDRLGTGAHLVLSAGEPFASDGPIGVDGPLRALTLHVQDVPFALLGLMMLVRERVQLGHKRGKSRQSRPQRAANRVAEDLQQDLLPHPQGPPRFPDDFFSPAARVGNFREIPLPTTSMRYIGPHFGKEQLITQDGQTLTVANKFEVRYLLFAQTSGQKTVRPPEKPVEISRTVNNYCSTCATYGDVCAMLTSLARWFRHPPSVSWGRCGASSDCLILRSRL